MSAWDSISMTYTIDKVKKQYIIHWFVETEIWKFIRGNKIIIAYAYVWNLNKCTNCSNKNML